MPLTVSSSNWIPNATTNVQEDDICRLPPINYPQAVRFEDSLHSLVKDPNNNSDPRDSPIHVISAPAICTECSSPRAEDSQKRFDELVLLCSNGPVRMRVETYRCSMVSCNAFIYAEGRNSRIVFYSFLTAATHAFMRRKLQAVII